MASDEKGRETRRGTSIGTMERHRRRIRRILEEDREVFDALATGDGDDDE